MGWDDRENRMVEKEEKGCVLPDFINILFSEKNHRFLKKVEVENRDDLVVYCKKFPDKCGIINVFGWKDSKTRNIQEDKLARLNRIIDEYGILLRRQHWGGGDVREIVRDVGEPEMD